MELTNSWLDTWLYHLVLMYPIGKLKCTQNVGLSDVERSLSSPGLAVTNTLPQLA